MVPLRKRKKPNQTTTGIILWARPKKSLLAIAVPGAILMAAGVQISGAKGAYLALALTAAANELAKGIR